VFLAERLEDGVTDGEAGKEDFFQFRELGLLPGIEGAGDLVQVVPDAPDVPENLAQCNMVGGRAALGAGAGLAKGSGAHEGGNGKAGLIGLGSDGGEFLVQAAGGNYLAALPLVTARHGRLLSRWRAPR
jgi:hypothetical protein